MSEFNTTPSSPIQSSRVGSLIDDAGFHDGLQKHKGDRSMKPVKPVKDRNEDIVDVAGLAATL
jgi:hypothetical protein